MLAAQADTKTGPIAANDTMISWSLNILLLHVHQRGGRLIAVNAFETEVDAPFLLASGAIHHQIVSKNTSSFKHKNWLHRHVSNVGPTAWLLSTSKEDCR